VGLYIHTPHTPSYRSASLGKHRDNFTFYKDICYAGRSSLSEGTEENSEYRRQNSSSSVDKSPNPEPSEEEGVLTERHRRLYITPASYLEGPWIKSLPGDRLSYVRVFAVFLRYRKSLPSTSFQFIT
jgi:hypothetical protein